MYHEQLWGHRPQRCRWAAAFQILDDKKLVSMSRQSGTSMPAKWVDRFVSGYSSVWRSLDVRLLRSVPVAKKENNGNPKLSRMRQRWSTMIEPNGTLSGLLSCQVAELEERLGLGALSRHMP